MMKMIDLRVVKGQAAMIVYLEKYGIDALRVLADTADESGFDYMVKDREGNHMMQVVDGVIVPITQRQTWPPNVWRGVSRLMAGADIREVGL